MVAASKMKKAQDRMRASRPYVERALQIAMHIAKANTEYKHPFLAKRETVKRVGAIVVTTDKGLCGGLNTNILRLVLNAAQGVAGEGARRRLLRDRQQGAGLPQPPGRERRVAARCSSATARTSTGWSGRSRCCSTSTSTATLDEVHIFFTTFINTMKQEAAARHDAADSRAVPHARRGRESASRTSRTDRGTTSTSRTRRSCSTACCAATSRR